MRALRSRISRVQKQTHREFTLNIDIPLLRISRKSIGDDGGRRRAPERRLEVWIGASLRLS